MPAEIPDGAFIVARAIFNSSIWTMRKDEKILAVTLIGLANWKERKWFDGKKERIIKRGELVRSVRKLSMEAGLTYQETRTSLRNLERAGFLTQESTQHYTIIRLPKYDKYQDLSRYADTEWPQELTQSLTHDQRTPNEPLTNPQRTLNDKQEGKEREERKEGEEGAPPTPACSVNDLEALYSKAIKRPEPSTGVELLMSLAQKQSVIAKLDTLRRYIEGWVANKGYQYTEQTLWSPECRGKDVLEIHDRWFREGKPNGKPQQPARQVYKCGTCSDTGKTPGGVEAGKVVMVECSCKRR